MNKEIRFTGYTASASDYTAPDGELALALNLLNEDGSLRQIQPPVLRLSIIPGHKLLRIHRVPGQENYILSDAAGVLLWMPVDSPVRDSSAAVPIPFKSPVGPITFITTIGNTLCAATSDGVQYFLWKDGAYLHLGLRPPMVNAQFACNRAGIIEDEVVVPGQASGSFAQAVAGSINPPVFGDRLEFDGDADLALWQSAVETGMAKLNSSLVEKVTSKGLFYQPFYVRIALRLYDGSYSWHSAPVLMLPTAHRPIIYAFMGDRGSAVLTDWLHLLLCVPFFSLNYRLFTDVEALKDWSDIVAGVDFFVSAPIYSYGLEPSLKGPARVKSLFPQSSTTDPFAGIYNGVSHFASDEVELSLNNWCLDFPPAPDFEDRLKFENIFYKIKSIDIQDISVISVMQELEADYKDLTNIVTLPVLPDEFLSHASVAPSKIHSYNQRLFMTDITLTPPSPLPFLCSVQQLVNTTADRQPVRSVRVFTRVNDSKCVSEWSANSEYPDYYISPTNLDGLPRFIYHPDPNAYMMELSLDSNVLRIPLKQHPHLNGAYFWGGLDIHSSFSRAAEDDTVNKSGYVPTKVYISNPLNPFIFPASSIVNIDCGRILGISTAAKALSQGQFGQYPLYAFTDDGVWALEVASTGVISARQPITRDVCTDPDAITQIDSAVLFPTARGIMLISGSSVKCLSDVIDNRYADSQPLSTLPHLSSVFLFNTNIINAGARVPFSTDAIAPFPDFLQGCGMAYDYPHQRLILFNKDFKKFPYAYVHSFRSGAWGMIHGSLAYSVNSYPEAMIVDSAGALLDFSQDPAPDSSFSSILVTRPIKLDLPDVLKTVDTVVSRGQFRRGSIMSILYGSRDLYNWHTVWSSRDHFLRGFSGTPYKYFRLALICSLPVGESLSGATFRFAPRYLNRPR